MQEPAFPRFLQLQERVKSLFYSYGLFCATHQVSTMLFAVLSVLFIIYPLKDTPILGNVFQAHTTPISNDGVISTSSGPSWYTGEPVGYVQQIMVRSTIGPLSGRGLPEDDSYQALLLTAFKIREQINQLQVEDASRGKITVSDICLRIAEPDVDDRERDLLPQFDCLLLSPASVWKNQIQVFETDEDVVGTVHSLPPRTREFLLGVPWLDVGLRKLTLRRRTVQYAVSIVYKTYNPEYTDKLTQRLLSLYPLSSVNFNASNVITHVSYKDRTVSYLADYTPLIAAYLLLFLYIYFSVQKIEMVKSKWGLALSAVVTVVASLLMSISICGMFGVTPSVNSGEIFPYLVVIIGFENVLVLTRSVVSTPLNLEVKFRIAEGLKKEGWFIIKHLFTELIILIIGFLTFVPAIQQFCLFASIGLLVDFYLQMVFFATVLSIDIRRLELSDLDRGHAYLHIQSDGGPVMTENSSPMQSDDSRSFARPDNDKFIVNSLFHIPKRIKVMNFLAQFRVVQRLIMLCTVCWISLVLYRAGVFTRLASYLSYAQPAQPAYFNFDLNDSRISEEVRQTLSDPDMVPAVRRVLHQDGATMENWRSLPSSHWPSIFSLYNKSLVGRYVSFMPPIKLSLILSAEGLGRGEYDDPEEEGREEKERRRGSVDGADNINNNGSFLAWLEGKVHLLNSLSGTEKAILCVTVLTALVLIVWLLVYLYSVMCRRDYAKWRKSTGRYSLASRLPRYKEILDDESSVYMEGLKQPIECLVCSGDSIICSDLAGDIRTWKASTGETMSIIDRTTAFVDQINADDDSKLLQQSGLESRLSGRVRCRTAACSSNPMSFDLAPFVATQFTTMKKRSFSDCLRDIEQERASQTNMMVSAHEDFNDEQVTGRFSTRYSPPPNIWCLDVMDGLIVAGCSDGSVEIWDSNTGMFRLRHKTEFRDSGIASINATKNKVIAGRTDGYLDFLEIYYTPVLTLPSVESASPSAICKGHRRMSSLNKTDNWREYNINCNVLQSIKAHQTSIGLLAVASGRCLTACEDKVINVYRADDANLLYMLQGHNDTIILLQADDMTATAQTASEDGMIRLWDLLTGACIHKLTGLIGPILNLTISSSYVIASSLESHICIWDKSSGRMMHSIHRNNCSYSGSITVLADSLLVSGGRDTLYFWDMESGELVYSITLPTINCMDGISKLSVMNSCTLVAAIGFQIHAISFRRIKEPRL
ncbi:sterol regulatory element-binding protein cleavage-activating protein-like [Watersipora subatra]|uniref:sterol regulatory element-binding protein cleavage-activating protein-like n=1 Tax=Watersipora subatra TaxID=2589382 RepID=UPI00355C9712